ncbi:MAG: hypothetical protein O3C20_23830 [Verrucomicrobia bacterium]|nr:hypothetical protein [Verrucomicrobiota bacterium]
MQPFLTIYDLSDNAWTVEKEQHEQVIEALEEIGDQLSFLLMADTQVRSLLAC